MNNTSPTTISTGGGAVVDGSAEAARDFIGRDNIRVTIINVNAPTAVGAQTGVPASGLHLLNFTRPITDAQRAVIEEQLEQPIAVMYEIEVEFDDNRAYGSQCVAVLDQVPLTGKQWQTTPLVVNLPGITPGAACLLSELHGRIGNFPPVVRLCRRPGRSTANYFVAEVIDLQAQRDKARQRAKSNQ
ncbi:MAG: CRISPR-associated protein Csx15 [Caldilineaceae bacterium]